MKTDGAASLITIAYVPMELPNAWTTGPAMVSKILFRAKFNENIFPFQSKQSLLLLIINYISRTKEASNSNRWVLIVIGYKEVRCESVKNVLESNSTEDEYSTHIDMMLNPDKINQYKMDVKKTEHDIRWIQLNFSFTGGIMVIFRVGGDAWKEPFCRPGTRSAPLSHNNCIRKKFTSCFY